EAAMMVNVDDCVKQWMVNVDDCVKQWDDEVRRKVETAKNLLIQEFGSERSHHQRLVKEHARLQQRLENIQGEMQILTSPTGHKRSPSDVSAISIESFTSSADTEKREDEEDQGYETAKRRGELARRPSSLAGVDVTADPKKMEDIDVGLLLKMQMKVKDLEKERDRLNDRLERYEEEGSQIGGINTDSAFDALK
ncbi:unconventional myosin-Vb-like, partial [Littorina saxatilis]|uniref:unconventional myosin-Vb-like n=1 Tax=Littorina saxatilis TaxID=31220 RepID=UPI0038B682B9